MNLQEVIIKLKFLIFMYASFQRSITVLFFLQGQCKSMEAIVQPFKQRESSDTSNGEKQRELIIGGLFQKYMTENLSLD